MHLVILDGGVLNPGDVSWAPFEALGTLTTYDDTSSRADLAKRVKDQDVVLVNKTLLRAEDVELFSSVRFLGVLATGYNNIDLEAFARHNIPVCNVRSYGVEDVAQHALAMLLELCRSTTLHSTSVKAGEWTQGGSWCYWKKPPICLADRTLGIIGYGNIGRCLGNLGHALGMHVLAYGRTKTFYPDFDDFAYVSLDELLERSDVISLHCPLTEETRQIINAKSLSRMRRGCILLNTARGPLIDEKACAEALKSGQLGGLGADVLSVEPPSPANPLLQAPNTLLTPHIAWASTRSRQRLIDQMAETIALWQKGTPRYVINGVQ